MSAVIGTTSVVHDESAFSSSSRVPLVQVLQTMLMLFWHCVAGSQRGSFRSPFIHCLIISVISLTLLKFHPGSKAQVLPNSQILQASQRHASHVSFNMRLDPHSRGEPPFLRDPFHLLLASAGCCSPLTQGNVGLFHIK